MTKKIAIAIIHGAGSQGPDFANGMIEELTKKFESQLPKEDDSAQGKLVFRPVHWANVLGRKQRLLWKTSEDDGDLGYATIRRFLLHFGADAIAYQPSPTRRHVYDRIHQTMTTALSELAQEAGPQAPLCVIGHSIGTVITHNYFFDLGQAAAAGTENTTTFTPLQAGKTLALLYMLGSPLALWSLRYDDYMPIIFPGQAVNSLYPQIRPKWVNYYDKYDVLAYPIRSLSKGHKELANQGLLEDIQVDAGNLLSSWNPMSHTEYWTDEDIINPIADALCEMWLAINSSSDKQ
jgi:hypothetical protein